MEKKITNTLLKELIDLDFAIAKTIVKKKNLNNVVGRLNLKDKEQFNILDIFKLNRSLKQFIRILYFLQSSSSQKSNLYRPKLAIYIWCTNKYILDLINIFLKKAHRDLRRYVFTTDVCPVATTSRDKEKKKFLFILGSPWEITPIRTLHEKILYNKFFLINTLDFNVEKSEFNSYKIQNDLADYKKLMVLLVIIERILSLHPKVCKPKTKSLKLFKSRKSRRSKKRTKKNKLKKI